MMKLPCYEKLYCSCLPVTLHKRFLQKSMSVAMDAREAPILFIILSLFIAVSLYILDTPYVLHTRIITVNEAHYTLSKSPYPRGPIYFQTKAVIVSSCPIALGRINVTVSVHTSIATHACMSVSESQKTWPKVSGHKKSSRCETFY